jgi:error-prone DNA polymerase
MGLRILLPDINRSERKYTGRDREIRVGLMQLKDLSRDGLDCILHERTKNGPFASLANFMERTGTHVHLQDVRVLIKAGCFNSVGMGAGRPALMWEALRFFHHDRTPAQRMLLEGLEGGDWKTDVPPAGQYSKGLMLKHEMETLGFPLSIHPLDRHKDILRRMRYVRAEELHAHVGREVTTIGWPITGKTVHTVHGDAMKFMSFEDQTGIYETVFFPKVYHRYCHMLSTERPYVLRGQVAEAFGAITINVKVLERL